MIQSALIVLSQDSYIERQVRSYFCRQEKGADRAHCRAQMQSACGCR